MLQMRSMSAQPQEDCNKMCGRYGLYDISDSEILKDNLGYEFTPNYNAAPTQSMPIITGDEGSPKVEIMQWGILRKLGPAIEKSIFNTRSEKALDRFWGNTVKTRRCLVPANGFYEWRHGKEGKVPYWIRLADGRLLYFAGIYDTDTDGERHYSIMTTTPNEEMESLHNRMPVILSDEARELWLSETANDPDMLSDLLRPAPDRSLEIFEVSRDVNVVRNNDGHLIEPVNSK
jgi:putative SOS response-associated peptidase YedK